MRVSWAWLNMSVSFPLGRWRWKQEDQVFKTSLHSQVKAKLGYMKPCLIPHNKRKIEECKTVRAKSMSCPEEEIQLEAGLGRKEQVKGGVEGQRQKEHESKRQRQA